MGAICKIAAGASLLLLWSCASQNSTHATRLSLPADVPLNVAVGREPFLIQLHLENGEDLPFWVDTGSPETILDRSLEGKLGNRIGTTKLQYGWKSNGNPTAGIYAAPKLYLGNVQLKTGQRIWTDDLTRLWPYHGMLGILGMDCLQNYCLQLDFQSKTMRFLDPDETPKWGKAFPLVLSRGDVSTRMDFFGRKDEQFCLDTADYLDGALSSALFSIGLQKQRKVWVFQSNEHDKPVDRGAYFDKCEFNNLIYTNMVFRDCSIGATENRNILGLSFFARHLATFNFPKRVMYLKQSCVGPFVGNSKSTNSNGDSAKLQH